MNNLDIRNEISKARIRFYEVAERLGIAETAFSRKLRKELPDDEKEKIRQIIKEIKEEF